MRILLVNYEFPPLGGGGGIAHRDLARAFATTHEVHVLTTAVRGLEHSARDGNVSLRRVGVIGRTDLTTATIPSMITFVPAALAAGMRLLRTFRPDVIHAFFAVPSGLPAVLLGRQSNTPTVVTLVGADIFDPEPTAGVATHRNPFVRAAVRSVLRRADALTAISEDTKRRALRTYAPSKEIHVIPLALPLSEMSARASSTTSGTQISSDAFRLITIGRLIPRKAQADLIASLALVTRQEISLDIIGSGPLEASLRAAAARSGVAHRVTFHGTVSDERKWELLRTAHAFVSSSLHEGFGIVFLEAMAAGLPIICTDVGGHTDYLLAGHHAIFVPIHQPRQLASAITLLWSDPALAQRMREANRERVERFHLEESAHAYEQLFEEVCTRRMPYQTTRRTAPDAAPVPAATRTPADASTRRGISG